MIGISISLLALFASFFTFLLIKWVNTYLTDYWARVFSDRILPYKEKVVGFVFIWEYTRQRKLVFWNILRSDKERPWVSVWVNCEASSCFESCVKTLKLKSLWWNIFSINLDTVPVLPADKESLQVISESCFGNWPSKVEKLEKSAGETTEMLATVRFS